MRKKDSSRAKEGRVILCKGGRRGSLSHTKKEVWGTLPNETKVLKVKVKGK